MFDVLYEMIYILLFAAVVIDFAVAHIMHWLNVGEARILSPIIGTAIGWLIIWLAPGSIAGIIVGAVVTVIANLVLTHLVYPKLGDKLDKHTEKMTKSRDEKEFDKILFSPTADERVKYLCRHMRWKKYYCFSFFADAVLVFNAIKGAVNISDLLANYPELIVKVYDPTKEKPDGDIYFEFQGVQLALVHMREEGQKDMHVLGIRKYEDDHLKLKERIALEDKIGHLLDAIYMISSNAIKTLDADCEIKFTR